MEVRLARGEETAQVKQLWDECFYEDPQYLQWVFGERYAADHAVVAAENGKVIGALQLIPCALRVGTTQQSCYYVAGVSVLLEYRGKGTAAAMMQFAEQVAVERKVSMLLLVPAINGYYERFGYVSCAVKEEYVFPASCAASYRFEGETRRTEEAEALLRVYEAYAQHWDVAALRSRSDIEEMIRCFQQPHSGICLFETAGQAVAYVVYHVTAHEINVPECAYCCAAGADAILQFIARYSMQTEKAVLRVAPGDPIYTKLYQAGVKRVLTPSFMAKKIGCTPAETFRYLGAGAGQRMALIGGETEKTNMIYINLPQWY